MPFIESWQDGTEYTEGRYSTAYRPNTDEFVFWSVNDHSYGRNRAGPGPYGAPERRRGFHVHGDRPCGTQLGPFMAAYNMV